MRVAIDHEQISPENYSRPQCSSVARDIICRLVFDCQQYLRQKKSLACIYLKGYYDQIVYSITILVLQHIGIPLKAIISMHDTIQRMTQMVRTVYGDSNIMHRGDTKPD